MSFFGRNIKKIRQLKSLSQQAMADLFQLKRATLGAYEEGRSEPKIDTIIRVAKYFSIPIDSLLTKELTINELLKFNTQLTTNESLHRKSFPKIPFIQKSNLKDYIKHFAKSSFIESMSSIQLPLDADKNYRAFEVQDLEMSYSNKGLFPKDIVIGEKRNISEIENEAIYLILTDECRVRKVQIEEEQISLIAEHPAIENIVLQAADVHEIWEVIGVYSDKGLKGFD